MTEVVEIVIDEFENKDAVEPGRSGVYRVDNDIVNALLRYIDEGIADPSIESGVKRIATNWFDFGYNERDKNERSKLAALYVIDKGEFREYDGGNIETRFSIVYTPPFLEIEEFRDILRK